MNNDINTIYYKIAVYPYFLSFDFPTIIHILIFVSDQILYIYLIFLYGEQVMEVFDKFIEHSNVNFGPRGTNKLMKELN